ncbi:DUF2213 domain-containing protein [Paraburkholderia sp. BCC1885]|uniref:DUF2213 domain-containing protein n=1 Tax=Paraburkholderia sp. BCC1885 TaxID=2562669 RepID=UPI001183E4C9|nr:DUF2213 domain-containing protein [Paraburkholderia sp. BCC1885]
MAIRFYSVEQLGPKQSLTPEGYLLCLDVPASRTGQMIYGPDETPVKADGEEFVRINRTDEEVFRPDAMASLNGKSVTNDHPDEDVSPANWKELEKGVVMNPRRGKGSEDDLLFVDLLIKDPDTIQAVRDGKREVSAGYDAEYFQTGPGQGEQRNILFNHVALVEKGRCGPRCAIGDHASIPQPVEKHQMATPSKWLKKILDRAHDAKDEEEMKKIADEAAEEESKAKKEAEDKARDEAEKEAEEKAKDKARDAEEHGKRLTSLEEGHKEILGKLDELSAKVGDKARDEEEEERKKKEEEEKEAKDAEAVEGELAEEAPAGTADRARKARDSSFLEESFQDTVALAEIIAPGIAIPTFDRAAAPIKSLDQMCGFRRKALDLAYVQAETRNMIDEVLAGKEFDLKAMKCDRVRDLFRAVGAMKRKANNTPVPRGWARDTGEKVVPKTLADINKMNRERFAAK